LKSASRRMVGTPPRLNQFRPNEDDLCEGKMANDSLSMVSPAALYSKLRSVLYQTPWLYKIARTIRFAALVGPWRPLLVGHYQRFSRNPKLSPIGPTLVPDVNAAEIASTLERTGFAIGGILPEDYVCRVAKLCPVQCTMIVNPHEKWDAVKELAYDPKFLEIARNYLGVEPVVCSSKIWWSVPGAKGKDRLTAKGHNATFHFDVADSKSLVVFIYLTDVVDGECGPHMVIEGTHKKKTLFDLVKVYLDDDTAIRRFGERIKTVLGRKGTFFFEEATAYHKGVGAKKPRLILAIDYTLHRKPVK
jgi:hypothetical protein